MARRVVALAGALGICLMVGSSVASAAVRYASPGGAPSPACEAATPCDLVTAVNSAVAGDEVIVQPGTYTIADGLQVSGAGMSVHGVVGQPKPVINTSGFTGVSVSSSAHIADLELNHSGTNLGMRVDGVAERVVIRSDTKHACVVHGLLRDSVCQTHGPSGAAGVVLSFAGATDATLRNVTAIGDNSPAVWANAIGPSGAVSIEGVGVIAYGSAVSGSQPDVRASTTDAAGDASVELTYSNFDASTPSGPGSATVPAPGSPTNQTAAPLFVNPGAWDFHQLVDSPTVDAGGLAVDSGTTDLDGDLRTLGNAPDIGADEYVPPDVTPPTLSLGGKRKQKLGKRVFVKATCANEACTATASGQLVVKGSPKRKFTLRKATAVLATGAKGTLELKLPKRARNAAAAALEDGNAVNAKLQVVARDAAGNAAPAQKRTVRLRLP